VSEGGRTLRDAIATTTQIFDAARTTNPRLDARVLVAHVVGVETTLTFSRGEIVLTADQERALESFIVRRKAGEPVARIVGRREFWGLDLAVTSDTLDPRSDTETLVAAVLDHAKRLELRAPRILDLGAGSGCVGLALLRELSDARVVATDISDGALHTAAENAKRVGLADRFSGVRTNWADGVVGPFDIVVSNPPYLSAADMGQLEPEVRFDPPRALDGGVDGLDCYRAIVADVARVAAPKCIIAFEVGVGQSDAVADLLMRQGFRVAEIRADLAAIPRCVVAEN
jgi:release factor glutamine methyltransferase